MGMLYPESSPFHGLKRVYIRSMTPREEEILLNISFYKDGTLIERLIASCLSEPKVTMKEVEELVVGDKQAILISLRITGYGSEAGLTMTCPECEAKSEISINLGKTAMQELVSDPNILEIGANLFQTILPTKKVVTWKYLTDIPIVLLGQQPGDSDEEDGPVIRFLLDSILSINGSTDKAYVNAMCRKMAIRDSNMFRKLVDSTKPWISITHNYDCEYCRYQELMTMACNNNIFEIKPGDREAVYLEPFFILGYYYGMTPETYMNFPVEYKRWLAKRINAEIEAAHKNGQNPPSKAPHDNDPQVRALTGKTREVGTTAPMHHRFT